MKYLIALGILILLQGCGGYSMNNYKPIPVSPDYISEAARSNEFLKITTFEKAIILYPNRFGTDYHTIPVGDYFLKEIMSHFKSGTLNIVELTDFTSKCDLRWPSFYCTSNARLLITSNNKTDYIKISDEVPAIKVVPGSIEVGVFGSDMEDTLHDVAKKVTVSLAKKAVEKLEVINTALKLKN